MTMVYKKRNLTKKDNLEMMEFEANSTETITFDLENEGQIFQQNLKI